MIERDAVEASDIVVAVTRPSLERIVKRYPQQRAQKFACANGYEPVSLGESWSPAVY